MKLKLIVRARLDLTREEMQIVAAALAEYAMTSSTYVEATVMNLRNGFADAIDAMPQDRR